MDIYVWNATTSDIASVPKGTVRRSLSELHWCLIASKKEHILIGIEERPDVYGHRWKFSKENNVLSEHTLFLLEPNVESLKYDGQYSILATDASHRKLLGSGMSKHGIVVAVTGMRRDEGNNDSSRSASYDTFAKTGSMTSVVYSNVLINNEEFVQWMRSLLHRQNQSNDNQCRILDAWDIGTAVITHMSKGCNHINESGKSRGREDIVGENSNGLLNDPKQVLPLLLDLLSENESLFAKRLSIYLKRHAWGFGCSFKQQVRTEEELKIMLSELKKEEKHIRERWVSNAVTKFVATYCKDGDQSVNNQEQPSNEEKVSICFVYGCICCMLLLVFLLFLYVLTIFFYEFCFLLAACLFNHGRLVGGSVSIGQR